MTQQFLDGPQVIAAFQQVGGERVAEGVAARRLCDARLLDRGAEGALQHALVQVVAEAAAGRLVDPGAGRGKHPLPGPLARRVRVFAGEAVTRRLESVALALGVEAKVVVE